MIFKAEAKDIDKLKREPDGMIHLALRYSPKRK
jgi:hypothetical protein